MMEIAEKSTGRRPRGDVQALFFYCFTAAPRRFTGLDPARIAGKVCSAR